MSADGGRRAPVHVHVGELRLEGFEPALRHRIARALERELVRLLEARGSDAPLVARREAGRVDGGSFSFRADDPPARIGAAIARATFRGLTGATVGRGGDRAR
jgi:hypothetical protein